MEEDLKKAKLILGGPVSVPNDFKIPVRISRSTAGPGAGSGAVVFSFGGKRVKKAITHDESEFRLVVGDGLSITKDGEPFIDGVTIEPVAFHCPEQAFFNLDQRCMFHCIYCASPLLDRNATKGLTDDRIVSMIRECKEPIEGIALTSGVFGSVAETVERMISCVRRLRSEFPELPIGVEPYVETEAQIDGLFEAGATEIKINCETARADIFEKACPELDYQSIFRMLAHSVDIFGKGHVATNIIVGLGESNEDVIALMEELSSKGIAPGIRGLKIGPLVKEKFAETMGDIEELTPERLVCLAKEQKRIMTANGLDTRSFKTMCFKCTCCDIVPFRDL